MQDCNINKTIILIDELLDNDHRVLKSIDKYNISDIVDCSKTFNINRKYYVGTFFYLFIMAQVLLFIPIYFFKLKTKYDLKTKGAFQGLKSSIFTSFNANKIAQKLKVEYKNERVELIYANDLMCGLVGMCLAKHFNAELIYDAHEVEFHRNRKNSFFRVAFDMVLEKKVVDTAKKIIVVNEPIKKLYMEIYNFPESKITVVNNNHFQPYMKFAIEQFNDSIKDVSIVYVGAGINGRMLEKLAYEANKSSTDVIGFFLGEVPQVAIEHSWKMGSSNYLPELLDLIKTKRLAMWCCTEDICLSYRLSLPNKFFQAIAVGIPIIAYKETYLAEIVKKYHIGIIYDGDNFDSIIDALNSKENYIALLESVSLFQEKLFLQKLVL